MKIVILGVGFLGAKLVEFFSKRFNVVCADINPRSDLVNKIDATNKQEIEKLLTVEKPDIVINTIALSSYFVCENNHKLCRKLNFESAKYIAEACKKIDAKMIFISSSYIFDGEKGNYLETDTPNSLNKYALSKIDAEKKVLELDGAIVIRSEPMYGFDKGKKQIIFGTNTFEVDVKIGFPNILRKPIFIDDVPPIIFSLVEKNQSGIFNIAGPTKLKWLDFLIDLSKLVNAQNKIKIVDNSAWILKPPYDSSLNTSKITSIGIKTTDFKVALKELKKLLLIYGY
jgi:dTDP-4-dehydrorhamnose reductase